MTNEQRPRRVFLRAVFLSTAVLALGSTGCRDVAGGTGSDGPTARPYPVTATIGMVGDIVREVAGGRAVVTTLIGEGLDPHLYKPTSPDVKALRSADVVFYNGLHLEGKMAVILRRLADAGRSVVAVAEDLPEGEDYLLPGDEEGHDPHVWMDVRGWMRAVETVASTLAAFDPEHADEYRERAGAYLGELEQLDEYVRRCVGTIPEKRRVLVTAHDAFGYMARAYGLEVRGIQGMSTTSEAGLQDIERLVDFLVGREIPAVFVESSVSEKNVMALVEGAAARGHRLVIGGELFSDAMGPRGSYEGTYIGMIDHNITTITRALGGRAPAGGLHGRLADRD